MMFRLLLLLLLLLLFRQDLINWTVETRTGQQQQLRPSRIFDPASEEEEGKEAIQLIIKTD